MATKPLAARDDLAPERAWWLRVPAVLLTPRSVFYALRDPLLIGVRGYRLGLRRAEANLIHVCREAD